MENKPEAAGLGKRLLLIGGGGHCHSVLDSVLAMGQYEKVGIVDSNDSAFLGISVVGTDDDIPTLINDGWSDAFITVGSLGDTRIRRRLYDMVRRYGLVVPTIIDPTAVIGKGTKICEGTFVGKRAVVNAGSTVGECAIINTGAIVEHDCLIGAFSHISPGAILCGQVRVGSDSHVGAGSVVRQLIEVGDGALIGAGSTVVKNIPDNAKAYGNPCKVVK